jgi:hypothetical protein
MSVTNRELQSLRQRGTARFIPVFFVLFVVALGALAAPALHPQDRDHDRDRDRDDRTVFIARENMVQDFGGGHGGRPSPDAICAPDSVAVGFHVQTGEFFNLAWLDCARVRRDGGIGDEMMRTEPTGSRGGRPVHDAICPNGFALRGLRGRTGASIDEAVGECTPLRQIANHMDRPRTEWTQSVTRPNPGGHPAAAECPPGFVVTGFRSYSGEYMDHLWVVCSEVRMRDHDGDRDHDRDR